MCLFYSDVVGAQHHQRSGPAATGTTRRAAVAVTTRPWADTGSPPTYPPDDARLADAPQRMEAPCAPVSLGMKVTLDGFVAGRHDRT